MSLYCPWQQKDRVQSTYIVFNPFWTIFLSFIYDIKKIIFELCELAASEGRKPVLLQTRLLCPWSSPGKNTGLGCHFLLQGIFQTQGSNPCLLYCRQIIYHMSNWGSPYSSPQRTKTPVVLVLVLGCVSSVTKLHPTFCDPTVNCQASLSIEFPRQEYWSGMPLSSSEDIPDPGINSSLWHQPTASWPLTPGKSCGSGTKLLKPLVFPNWWVYVSEVTFGLHLRMGACCQVNQPIN